MSSGNPASLSPDDIVAALTRRIEHYHAVADGSRQLGAECDAAEALMRAAKLRKVRDEFMAWLVAQDHRRSPQTARVFTFRRRKAADSAA